MQTYTFTTPLTISTGLSDSITVKSVQLTAINISTTPELAQIGTGTMSVTLTDPATGYQEVISYSDASVITFWQATAPTPATGDQNQDVVAKAVFAKLISDNKLPGGTLT